MQHGAMWRWGNGDAHGGDMSVSHASNTIDKYTNWKQCSQGAMYAHSRVYTFKWCLNKKSILRKYQWKLCLSRFPQCFSSTHISFFGHICLPGTGNRHTQQATYPKVIDWEYSPWPSWWNVASLTINSKLLSQVRFSIKLGNVGGWLCNGCSQNIMLYGHHT